jgi:outer membrane receptor for Fe3+-dicitrate
MAKDIIIDLKNLFDDLIKSYEREAKEAILYYSTDKVRDFKLLSGKLEAYKKQCAELLEDVATRQQDINEVRA